jgi:hypothetical protein
MGRAVEALGIVAPIVDAVIQPFSLLSMYRSFTYMTGQVAAV